jgi:post-segregation antitoxin (ccd killing protein)
VDDNIAFGPAKKLLDSCCVRANLGLATLKQVGLMISLGMEAGQARIIRKDKASAWIGEALKAQNQGAAQGAQKAA